MLNPGQVVERYAVESLLGTGGMAVVYRVRHTQLASLHALKILTVTSPQIRERLLQEGRVQAALRHPNVVAVTDVIDVAGNPGLVMEYVDGPALDEWLGRNRPTLDEAETLFRGVLAGVAAAHAVDVVHRDLKPANVMLSGPTRVPKVTDFGLAKAFSETKAAGLKETRSGMTMGTPAYMAPEQIRDAKSVDRRADVFSLGCILYELVCGKSAFSGPDILSIFNAVAQGEFAPPLSLVPDLPPRIQDAITGSLVVDRDKRIPDCETLLAVLDGTGPKVAAYVPAGPPRPRVTSLPTWDETPSPARGAGGGGLAQLASEPLPGLVERTVEGSLAPRRVTSLGASLGSLAPRRSVFVVGLAGLGAAVGVAAVVALIGAAVVYAGATSRAQDTLRAALGPDATYGTMRLRPGRVELDHVTAGGLTVDHLELAGRWDLGGGASFQPSGLTVTGAHVGVEHTAQGWVGAEALAGWADRAREAAAVASIDVHDLDVTLTDAGDALVIQADHAAWARDDAGGTLTLTGTQFGALGSIGRLEVRPAGDVVAEDVDVELALRDGGTFDVPIGLSDVIPVWFGGGSPRSDVSGLVADLAPWLGVSPRSLSASGGTISLVDRAHGVRAVRWDTELVNLSVGPTSGGYVPIAAVTTLGGARITVEGDVDERGMVRGRASAVRLPLDPMHPYWHDALTRSNAMITGGTLDGDLRFGLMGESFAARLDGEASGVTTADGRALSPGPIPVRMEVAGSLAAPHYSPGADLLDAIAVALVGQRAVERAEPPPAVVADAAAAAPDAPAGPAAHPRPTPQRVRPAPQRPRGAASPGASGGGAPIREVPAEAEAPAPAEPPTPPTSSDPSPFNQAVRDVLDDF